MKKVGITLLIMGFVAALAGGYYFLYMPGGTDVVIEFIKPAQVYVGQSFQLSVSFSNASDKAIKDAKLSLVLPAGVEFVGDGSEQRVRELTVGDVGAGSLNQQQFTLIATDGAQSLKHIEARLRYMTAGNSSTFEARSAVDIPVGEASAIVSITAPEKVYSGENFDVVIKYQNNSDQDIPNLKLNVDYTPTFQFQKSTVQPTSGNNVWDLGTLARGSNGSITVTGNIVGPELSFVNFNASLTSDRGGQTYTVKSQMVNLSISTPPLSVGILANGNPTFIAQAGDHVTYTLSYKNNANIPLQDVTVRANFTGEMFDLSKVESDGSFNSTNKRITWTAATTPALGTLEPGAEGNVTFSVQLKSAFPITRIGDKNFVLKVDAQIESPTVPPGTASGRTLSVARLESKVAGRLEVVAKGYYRDAASGIVNTGPFPPKANAPTRYTIHWVIKNYSTDMANVKLSAFLQPNSRFTGKVKSSIEAKPVYNQNSGQVTWDVGAVAATRGLIGQPFEAIFQIETTPGANQVGQIIPLLSDTKVQGTDTFVDQGVNETVEGVFTDLKYDATVANTDNRVQP